MASYIRRPRWLPPRAPSPDSDQEEAPGPKPPPPYRPTPTEIVAVRELFARNMHLPPEIVLYIFDLAEYWAHSTNEIDFLAEHQSPLKILAGTANENKFILRSYPVGFTNLSDRKELSEILAYDMTEVKAQPLGREHEPSYFTSLAPYPSPALSRPVRKIVFSFRAKDQGWGGERMARGTFRGAWTWFEAGLERFDADAHCDPLCSYDMRHRSNDTVESPLPVCALRQIYPPPEPVKNDAGEIIGYKPKHPLHGDERLVIQRNRAAHKKWQDHCVTWSYTGQKPTRMVALTLVDSGRGAYSHDGTFVRDLKIGDVVTVWAKTRFPGWTNNIEKAKIEVYWAVA